MSIEINKLLDIIKKAGYEEIPTNYNRLYFNTIDVSVIVDKALEQQQAEIERLKKLIIKPEVLGFLKGRNNLNGRCFREASKQEKGKFWWRRYLPKSPEAK